MVRQRRYPILVFAVMVAALLLRLVLLDAKSFDLDEAVSITYARLGLVKFVSAVSWDPNMSLYYGLLWLWRHVGESEASIRFLSVIPSVATVPAVYALGARLFSNTVGLIAALLLCVNAFHIRYAQEARSYSLVVLLVVLSCLFLVDALEHPSRRNVAKYVTASVLALYSHFFAGLVLLAQCVSLAIAKPRRVPRGALLMSSVAIGLLTLPPAFFVVARDQGQLSWLSWIPRPTTHAVIDLFRSLTAGGASPRPLLVAYLAACLLAVVGACKAQRSWKVSWQAWRYALLFFWLLVPILLTLLISIVKPLFMSHYLIVCLPALVLLAAVGLSRINHRWLLAGALAVVVGFALRGDYDYYMDSTLKEDFRGATRYVLERAQPGDAIVFLATYVKRPFDYYRSRLAGATGSEGIAILPGSVSYGRESVPLQHDRVWLFLSHDEYFPVFERSIEASLAARYPSIVERTFYGVRVRLYSRPAEPLLPNQSGIDNFSTFGR